MRKIQHTDRATAAKLTVSSHVVSQKPLRRKAFRTVGTLEHLTCSTHTAEIRQLLHDRVTTAEATFTIHVLLSNDVVEEFGVVGVHPPTAWTGHHLLLGVAAQVLS